MTFYEQAKTSIKPGAAITSLYHFQPWMPLAIVTLCAFLVGSLYITALEGLVDWIHRSRLGRISKSKLFSLDRIYLTLSPMSKASSERLILESRYYYRQLNIPQNAPMWLKNEKSFIIRNQADVLWMEGKLVGSPLKSEYRQYRSEGEWQLGVAILLPFISGALLGELGISNTRITAVIILFSLLAFKLAGYGFYYYRKANSLVAHHIADGSLKTPSMETAQRLCN